MARGQSFGTCAGAAGISSGSIWQFGRSPRGRMRSDLWDAHSPRRRALKLGDRPRSLHHTLERTVVLPGHDLSSVMIEDIAPTVPTHLVA